MATQHAQTEALPVQIDDVVAAHARISDQIVRTPTLISRTLADLTGATLRYIDDANVLVMLDQPEQTAREIGAFLTRAE